MFFLASGAVRAEWHSDARPKMGTEVSVYFWHDDTARGNAIIEAIYAELEREPISAASLGQVHRGVLLTGEKVAVKVQRPGLREQIFTEDGSLNRFGNVYVNGRDVRYEQELATPVGESDEVILLPAMAGGR